VTAAGMVSGTSANGVANTVANSVLPVDDEPSLRRWLIAAVAVVLVHTTIVFWILYVRDMRAAGEPPAAVMIELAPVDVAPPSETPPDVTPGPQMTKAAPEEAEQPQVIPVPELPPAPKPDAILTTPPKPKPKPKKIVKEISKPVVKPAHQPPAPQTSAPPGSTAARAAQPSAGGGGAHSNWSPRLSISRTYPEAAKARGEQGVVRVSITFGRSGHAISAQVAGSSGSAILDQAALASARQASLPPLPPEMGSSITRIVPIRYSIH